MSKQNKKNRRQELLVEIEALEKRILDCYFIIEREEIEILIKILNRELKNLKD